MKRIRADCPLLLLRNRYTKTGIFRSSKYENTFTNGLEGRKFDSVLFLNLNKMNFLSWYIVIRSERGAILREIQCN